MNTAASVQDTLTSELGGRWAVQSLQASSFCATWRAEGAEVSFVKSVPMASAGILLAEADGLRALSDVHAIRVPAVIGCWSDERRDIALLALQWLDLKNPDAAFGDRFGRALASLHRTPATEGGGRFGWRCDNMLGGTPQPNRWSGEGGLSGWLEFFGRERLGAMRERLLASHVSVALADAVNDVIQALPAFFHIDGYQPQASLIHGDLWSGNWGMLEDGTPVIYDPAVSYSDAEAELAMLELFGSPPAGFWSAYRESIGTAPGHAQRRGLYQLYHLLNHALLFGGGYVRQSLSLAQALVSGTR